MNIITFIFAASKLSANVKNSVEQERYRSKKIKKQNKFFAWVKKLFCIRDNKNQIYSEDKTKNQNQDNQQNQNPIQYSLPPTLQHQKKLLNLPNNSQQPTGVNSNNSMQDDDNKNIDPNLLLENLPNFKHKFYDFLALLFVYDLISCKDLKNNNQINILIEQSEKIINSLENAEKAQDFLKEIKMNFGNPFENLELLHSHNIKIPNIFFLHLKTKIYNRCQQILNNKNGKPQTNEINLLCNDLIIKSSSDLLQNKEQTKEINKQEKEPAYKNLISRFFLFNEENKTLTNKLKNLNNKGESVTWSFFGWKIGKYLLIYRCLNEWFQENIKNEIFQNVSTYSFFNEDPNKDQNQNKDLKRAHITKNIEYIEEMFFSTHTEVIFWESFKKFLIGFQEHIEKEQIKINTKQLKIFLTDSINKKRKREEEYIQKTAEELAIIFSNFFDQIKQQMEIEKQQQQQQQQQQQHNIQQKQQQEINII